MREHCQCGGGEDMDQQYCGPVCIDLKKNREIFISKQYVLPVFIVKFVVLRPDSTVGVPLRVNLI